MGRAFPLTAIKWVPNAESAKMIGLSTHIHIYEYGNIFIANQ